MKLKNLLYEFSLRSFPDWNRVQADIFRKLKKDYDLNERDYLYLGEILRDHMNKNYFSGTWNVDKSSDELKDELFDLSSQSLRSRKSE